MFNQGTIKRIFGKSLLSLFPRDEWPLFDKEGRKEIFRELDGSLFREYYLSSG